LRKINQSAQLWAGFNKRENIMNKETVYAPSWLMNKLDRQEKLLRQQEKLVSEQAACLRLSYEHIDILKRLRRDYEKTHAQIFG